MSEPAASRLATGVNEPGTAGSKPRCAGGLGSAVIAVVPAHDEARRVGWVVAAALRHVSGVIVVDDGSRDETAAAALRAGAEVVRHPRRLGKGAGIRTALETIRGRGHDYVLCLDGDGQHDPSEIPRLLAAAEERAWDAVIGHRLSDRRAHRAVRYYTNVVACNMLSRWTGHEVFDSQSGFRLIRARMLDQIQLESRGFEIETEVLLKLCRRGARVAYVEVRGGEPSRKSRLRPVRDVTRICLSAVKYQYVSL